MLTKSIEVMRYVKASAGRSNLRVVFEDVNQPRHNGTTIFLPKITTKTTEQELLSMMASTDHEVAHDLYSDFGLLREKNVDAQSSSLGFIWNVLEDSRVNNLEAADYEGFRELWDEVCPTQLKEIIEKTETTEHGLAKIIRSMMKWETTINRSMFPLCAVACCKMTTTEEIDKLLEPFTDRLLE